MKMKRPKLMKVVPRRSRLWIPLPSFQCLRLTKTKPPVDGDHMYINNCPQCWRRMSDVQ